MSVRVIPSAHPSAIVLVPSSSLYNSPRLQTRVHLLLSITLLELAFIGAVYHHRSLTHHSFKRTHLGIYIGGVKATRFISGISSSPSPSFHTQRPITFSDVRFHTHSHPHLEKNSSTSFRSDSIVPPSAFCSIANAGPASSSSLYY